MRTKILGWYILLIIIILIGGLLRFYKLSEYPLQLNHDEISQLYDTASIMQTGKDIYGNFLPLAFPSTGDFKVGHYIYITTIPYLLFGDKEETIRIPGAFFGTLTILAVFLFVKILIKRWTIAILSAAIIAITPSEVFYSRKSFESILGVFLSFFGLYCLLNSLETRKKIWGYVGVLLLALAMYAYTSFTIIIPILIILLTVVFKNEISLQKKNFAHEIIFWVICIIPLIILTFLNSDLRFRAESVFITQDVNLGRAVDLNENYLKSFIDYIFIKFLNQVNPVYLFINGLDLTNQYILNMGPLLIWQFPLTLLGAIFLIRNKNFLNQRNFLFGILIISFIPSAITFEDFSPHRSMLAFTTLSIISAFGLYWLILLIQNRLQYKNLKLLSYAFLISTLTLNLAYFLRIYTESYPYEKSQKIQYPFKQVAEYIWSQYDNFDQIIFDPQFGQTAPIIGVGAQYYIAYYGNYLPEKLQKDYKIGKKPRETKFDKFSIRQVYWPEDKQLKNVLIIASPWSIRMDDIDERLIVKRFDFYDGQAAFYAIKL